MTQRSLYGRQIEGLGEESQDGRGAKLKHSLESRSAEDPEHHFDAKVGLGGLNPTTTEKPCEIGGGWVGSIQLSERGNEEEDRGRRHALTYHTSLNECQVRGL